VTDKRYSVIVVLLSAAIAVGIAFFSLGSGLLLGYQWGKSAGRAEALAELPAAAVQSIGPLLEQLMPGGGGRLEQFFPPGNRDELPFPSRTYLGVTFRVITPELQEEEGLDEAQGALIIEVARRSPAAEAELRQGDIILAVDGAQVTEDHPLDTRIGSYEPGEQIELTIIRNGRRLTVELELGTRPR